LATSVKVADRIASRVEEDDYEKLEEISEEILGSGEEIAEMGFSKGIELDWNPLIGIREELSKPEKRLVAEDYASELEDFLDRLEQPEDGIPEDIEIGHVIGSVHDVNVDYEPLYVKKEENFRGMDHDELFDVVDTYFEKMELMLEYDGIFDKLAHPSLIERNDILMETVTREAYEILDHQVKEELIYEARQEYEQHSGWKEAGIESLRELYDLKMRNTVLRDYYSSVVDKLKDSEITPEINGKGLERQEHPSEFWYLVLEENLEYEIGSDSHRPNEITDRRSISALERA
jgi:histidinol phosphatase-like PHP family hydrolase